MKFGLIGRSLKHSFSKEYFTRKFSEMGVQHSYENFEINDILAFRDVIQQNPGLKGLNVTIPYKQEIIPLLDSISPEAMVIGAVNTITTQNGECRGYNTDVYGFEKSLRPLLKPHHTKALILGTGGVSLAVAYVLTALGIHFHKVSRTPDGKEISYNEASKLLSDHYLVINCTPLGTFPAIKEKPPLEGSLIGEKHLCYDLIYNPEQTQWLAHAAKQGAATSNGRKMLELQAEKSWEIWNEF